MVARRLMHGSSGKHVILGRAVGFCRYNDPFEQLWPSDRCATARGSLSRKDSKSIPDVLAAGTLPKIRPACRKEAADVGIDEISWKKMELVGVKR